MYGHTHTADMLKSDVIVTIYIGNQRGSNCVVMFANNENRECFKSI